MKLIDSSVELISDGATTIEEMKKQIELVGRVCTKSESKITEDSYEKFVESMRKLNHGAVLEHGTIYLTIPYKIDGVPNTDKDVAWSHYYDNPYVVQNADDKNVYITTNFRVFHEDSTYYMRFLKYMTAPTENHERRITVKFRCSRAIANEFVRHRQFSFMQESTRYVNYTQGLEFIKPQWYIDGAEYNSPSGVFKSDCEKLEDDYIYVSQWLKPQEARDLLPLCTATTLYMTGTISQWEHFFKLRSPKYGAQGVHPDAAKLADELYDIFINNNYLNNVDK